MSNLRSELQFSAAERRKIILGMRAAYSRNENVMEFARRETTTEQNSTFFSLVAYDLQAGSYVKRAREFPEKIDRWASQIAGILDPFLAGGRTLLEVGCGEATTLAAVLARLEHSPRHAFGFDICWSRCSVGRKWLAEAGQKADLFVADLLAIPLADKSVDVVFTSHALEPNGGNEELALRELIRVARHAVVLIEPIYEFGTKEAQARMAHHRYVTGLRSVADRVGARVVDYRPLDYTPNPLNPTGVLALDVSSEHPERLGDGALFRCPLTGASLRLVDSAYFAEETGVVYPILNGIPLLRIEHSVIASALLR